MTAPPITQITSRSNPLLVRLRKLAMEPGAYRKFGEIWIEGEHLCAAYLARGGPPPRCVIGQSGWSRPALRELASRCEAVAVVDDVLLAGSSGLDSPAPIGFVVPWRADAATVRDGEPTVVLDRLQDAGNVGTILRSAAAFGFTQIVALSGTAALWSPKVVRAGMGAHFGLHLVEQADLHSLSALTVPLIATSSHAAETIDRARLPWPCAWLFGHEGQGVAAELMQRSSLTLGIPQPGGEESLNVAAAAAVCLYESARQRRTPAQASTPRQYTE
ncbi:MAG TPA: RNA methyltransferase [Burkholderiaceae bacterium]|nr:RNA methyltransferase [Burkholderiaceae bacterium]